MPAGPQTDKVPDGARIRLGTTKLRHSGEISAMALSPDGKFMITLRNGMLYRWNMDTGFIERTHQHQWKDKRIPPGFESPGSCEKPLVLSTDGKMLAYQVGEEIHLIPADLKGPQVFSGIQNYFPVRIHAMRFKDDTQKLVILDSQNLVIDHSSTKKDFRQASNALKGNHFELTANHCAISTDEGFAVLYDWRNQKLLHQFAEKGIVSLAFSPDGRYLALSTYKSEILIWDANENKEVTRYRFEGDYAHKLAITPDGQRLFMEVHAEGKRNTVQIHDWKNKKVMLSETFPIYYRSQILMSHDGKRCFAVGRPGAIVGWEVETGRPLSGPGHAGAITSMQWTNNDELLSMSDVHDLRLWNAGTGKELHSFQASFFRLGNAGFTLSKDRQLIYTAGPDGQLHEWNLQTRKPVKRIGAQEKLPFTERLTLSPNGKFLAGRNYKGIRVWSLEEKGDTWLLNAANVPALAFASDDLLLTWNRYPDYQLRLWDFKTQKVTLQFEARTDRKFDVFTSRSADLTPDRKYFVCTQSKRSRPTQVGLWDLATGKLARQFELPADLFGEAAHAVSPDGKVLLVGDSAGVIHALNIDDGERRGHFKDGHRGSITSLAVSPDGRSFASGSADTSIVVWNLAESKKRE